MLTFTALVVLAAAVYGAWCVLNPFTMCTRCYGGGERSVWMSRDVVTCRSCRGAGARLRAGARLWHTAMGRTR